MRKGEEESSVRRSPLSSRREQRQPFSKPLGPSVPFPEPPAGRLNLFGVWARPAFEGGDIMSAVVSETALSSTFALIGSNSSSSKQGEQPGLQHSA